MSNPTAAEVTFDVVLAGPGLLGEPAVTLGPGESCSYEAVFSPLVPGAAQGCVFPFHSRPFQSVLHSAHSKSSMRRAPVEFSWICSWC